MVGRSYFPIAVSLMAVLSLSACGEEIPMKVSTPAAAAPSVQVTPTVVASVAQAASPTAVPAAVSVATVVSVQTQTPTPTPTPTPRGTVPPAPTEVPAPTATPPPPTPTPEPEPSAVLNGEIPLADEVLQTEADERLTTVEVVKILRPSVVHIATQVLAMGMFNQPVPLEGVGTGVVLDKVGHILTNNHVVQGAEQVVVTLNTGESFFATAVGFDLSTDTAVIKIEAEGLQPAKLGDASTTEVGEDVIAIGHALGLPGGPTVSKGVVSALGRSIESDPQTQTTIVDLIQTDASINPGNSGGPLVNDRAEVIGINTAIIQESRGIGFAINIDDAKEVAIQLIENGFVQRGFLGITPINVTPALASQFNLPVREGILLVRVITGFAAEEAGLQEGDVIVQLGDEPIANTGEMSKFLLAHLPGETVTIVYFRGPDEITTEVTLGERPRE